MIEQGKISQDGCAGHVLMFHRDTIGANWVKGAREHEWLKQGRNVSPMVSSVMSFAILTTVDFQRQFWNQCLETCSETERPDEEKAGCLVV